MRIFGYKAKGNSIKYLLCEDSNSNFSDENQIVSFREISYPYSFLILSAPDEEEDKVRQKELPLLIIVRPEYLEEESDAPNYYDALTSKWDGYANYVYCGDMIDSVYAPAPYPQYEFRDWFLKVIPKILQSYKENRHGSPGQLGENCHEEWDRILDEMIFMFHEADEDSCSKKNKFEESWTKAYEEFENKYGWDGDGLKSKEQKEKEKKEGYSQLLTLGDADEYKEISKNFLDEELRLEAYRERCKNRAFELLSKYFFDLWD